MRDLQHLRDIGGGQVARIPAHGVAPRPANSQRQRHAGRYAGDGHADFGNEPPRVDDGDACFCRILFHPGLFAKVDGSAPLAIEEAGDGKRQARIGRVRVRVGHDGNPSRRGRWRNRMPA